LREEERPSVLANSVLRKICGFDRDDKTGYWRKLHNEAFNDMCSSTKIIRLIKSIRIRYAGHVAYKETDEVPAWFWWGDLMEGVHLKYLVIDVRVILNGTLTSGMGDRT
jgi:hypothetical protein